MTRLGYLTRVGTVISQAINALVCNGHPDMSLSTRAYLERDTSAWWLRVYWIAEILFGAGHCRDSFESDVQFANDIKQIEASL